MYYSNSTAYVDLLFIMLNCLWQHQGWCKVRKSYQKLDFQVQSNCHCFQCVLQFSLCVPRLCNCCIRDFLSQKPTILRDICWPLWSNNTSVALQQLVQSYEDSKNNLKHKQHPYIYINSSLQQCPCCYEVTMAMLTRLCHPW